MQNYLETRHYYFIPLIIMSVPRMFPLFYNFAIKTNIILLSPTNNNNVTPQPHNYNFTIAPKSRHNYLVPIYNNNNNRT